MIKLEKGAEPAVLSQNAVEVDKCSAKKSRYRRNAD